MIYALQEIEDGEDSLIGIFDYTDISDKTLSLYFGDCKTVKHMNIEDSGIAWYKTIFSNTDYREYKLVLTEHELNEI